MKVYVLIYDDDWNDIHRVEGVYSSFEKAQAAKKDLLEDFNGEHGVFGICTRVLDA